MTVEYHGYIISCERVYPQADVVQYDFDVYKNNEGLYHLSFGASELYLHVRNIFDPAEKEKFVRIGGLKRVYAILDLGKFKKGEKQEYMLTTEDSNKKSQETLSDIEIRHEILKGFYNVFKNCPEDYKSQNLPSEGICELLNIGQNQLIEVNVPWAEKTCKLPTIEQNRYQYNLNWLIAKGYLEHPYNDPKSGTYITGKGLELIESEEKVGSVIDSIFRDTREFVDAELMQICPEVFKKLTETYKDLETGQSELDWKQVAFACRDILQDFTKAIFRNEYVPHGEERPRREQTANKIRLIVESATNSKTERIFIPALAEYLSQYFEGLNKLIQKYTHGSPDITKEDANRCLIYTYLFVRDVLKIIKG